MPLITKETLLSTPALHALIGRNTAALHDLARAVADRVEEVEGF